MEAESLFLKVSSVLESKHGIFAMLWTAGKPVLTDKVERASVSFDDKGDLLTFSFNPEFIKDLSIEDLAYIVAHQCLHVMLEHGKRMKGLNEKVADIAADIIADETLINSFGFNPSDKIRPHLRTINAVFPEPKKIAKDREFEYYYKEVYKLIGNEEQQQGDGEGKGKGIPDGLDSHDGLPDKGIEEVKDAIDKLSAPELQELLKMKAGDSSMFQWIKQIVNVRPNPKWQEFIKEFTIKKYREKHKVQWKVLDRRFTSIQKLSPGVHIPSCGPIDEKAGVMIDMTFFMDVSGSCHRDSIQFFSALKSIPRDKFIINPLAFDTKVIKLDINKDDVPYGGGTAFHQLEEYCLQQPNYPSCVFVLTDGDGTNVNPKYPERWHVFLTSYGNTRCFSDKCNFYEFDSVKV